MTSTQLTTCLPAEARALRELRRQMNELLASAGVAEPSRQEAVLVAHELAANTIEHGSGANDEIEFRCKPNRRAVQLRLAVLDNTLRLLEEDGRSDALG